jgi:hypothetical protein
VSDVLGWVGIVLSFAVGIGVGFGLLARLLVGLLNRPETASGRAGAALRDGNHTAWSGFALALLGVITGMMVLFTANGAYLLQRDTRNDRGAVAVAPGRDDAVAVPNHVRIGRSWNPPVVVFPAAAAALSGGLFLRSVMRLKKGSP